jgi:hypothetical protein
MTATTDYSGCPVGFTPIVVTEPPVMGGPTGAPRMVGPLFAPRGF